jgi:hypothetical protein
VTLALKALQNVKLHQARTFNTPWSVRSARGPLMDEDSDSEMSDEAQQYQHICVLGTDQPDFDHAVWSLHGAGNSKETKNTLTGATYATIVGAYTAMRDALEANSAISTSVIPSHRSAYDISISEGSNFTFQAQLRGISNLEVLYKNNLESVVGLKGDYHNHLRAARSFYARYAAPDRNKQFSKSPWAEALNDEQAATLSDVATTWDRWLIKPDLPSADGEADRNAALSEILQLSDGWDGEGSLAPSPEACATAMQVFGRLSRYIPESEVEVDGSTGEICLTWYFDGHRSAVSITIFSSGNVVVVSAFAGQDGWRLTLKPHQIDRLSRHTAILMPVCWR